MTKQIMNENSSDWESGKLGQDENFVEKVEIEETSLNRSLKLKAVSIRLQESMIEDLKLIGQVHGIGYQPLMRQVLNRFIESEKKQLLREMAVKAKQEATKETASKEKHRKTA